MLCFDNSKIKYVTYLFFNNIKTFTNLIYHVLFLISYNNECLINYDKQSLIIRILFYIIFTCEYFFFRSEMFIWLFSQYNVHRELGKSSIKVI